MPLESDVPVLTQTQAEARPSRTCPKLSLQKLSLMSCEQGTGFTHGMLGWISSPVESVALLPPSCQLPPHPNVPNIAG